MRFGKMNSLKTAKGKIGAGLVLILFGVVAILAAPRPTDKLICSLVVFAGACSIALGIRQDRAEKDAARHKEREEEK